VRRDVRKVLRGIRPRYTLEAAELLPGFHKPVLIAWADRDRFFPREHADRLAKLLPDARVETIADSRTFISLDQPAKLAELIRGFVPAREPAAAPKAAR